MATEFYPSAFGLWPKGDIIGTYNELSEAASQVEAKQGMGPMFSPSKGNITDDEGADEQAEERLVTAADMQVAVTDDTFPNTTKRAPTSNVQCGCASARSYSEDVPFPAMAMTQKETEEAKGSMEVVEPSTEAEGHEEIERASAGAEEP